MTEDELRQAITRLDAGAVDHVTMTLDRAGNAFVRVCTHCGIEDRLPLPRPAAEMKSATDVPAGFGERLTGWMQASQDAHRACPAPAASPTAPPTAPDPAPVAVG